MKNLIKLLFILIFFVPVLQLKSEVNLQIINWGLNDTLYFKDFSSDDKRGFGQNKNYGDLIHEFLNLHNNQLKN